MMSHVSIGTNDFTKAVTFYDAVFEVLGVKRLMEHPEAVAYGKQFPEFWVQTPHDGASAGVANGSHFAFLANSRAEVDAFFKVAIEMGALPDGDAGPRPLYGEPYYGCFVRDLDGHKIEAMFWDESLA